jgi:hypothetical protein
LTVGLGRISEAGMGSKSGLDVDSESDDSVEHGDHEMNGLSNELSRAKNEAWSEDERFCKDYP